MAGEGEGPPQMVFGTQGQISQLLDGSILERFAGIDQGGKVAAEYVWLGGSMSDLRSKTKTLNKVPKSVDDLPDWNYDGSSTGQAPGTESAVGSDQDAEPQNYPILCSCTFVCCQFRIISGNHCCRTSLGALVGALLDLSNYRCTAHCT